VTTLEFRQRLARRTRRAKAPISLSMLEPLEAYFRLLTQWNAKINLTALPLEQPTDEAFDRLLVEPLAASKQIPTHSAIEVVDLGSGGGSPAIPLRIARPHIRLTMVESKDRKSAFLREAVRLLSLDNAIVETARFEELGRTAARPFQADVVTVRAVKLDLDLFQTAERLLKADGRLFLFRPSHSPTPDPPQFKMVSTSPLIDAPPTFLTTYRKLFHVEHQ
jgi:16S rRNA (guanine527-N7)-methyltransferase